MANNGAVQPRSRILVGIDYGTTYTGLAYTTERPDTTTTLSDITSFRWWPAKQQAKVPSAISYSITKEGKSQWGADIDDNSDVLQWTKLELQPKDTLKELKVLKKLMQGLQLVRDLHNGQSKATPRQISKSSEDIVRDYLLRVTGHWHNKMTTATGGEMKAGGRNTFRVIPVDLVITHPVNWKYEALNKTYRAIMGAMPQGKFPKLRDVYMISEPEACALYTVRDMIDRERNTLVEGECFVLCDAGGGTVDLVSYRIDSVEPLSITRVGQLAGSQCGATFIDREFLIWCSEKLDNMGTFDADFGTGGHFVMHPKVRILLERFEIHKHSFEGTRDADIQIPNSMNIRDPVAADTGTLYVSPEDMISFFDKSVEGTVDLIRRQIAQIDGRTIGGKYCHVTNIFLAGGLSENPYVRARVRQCAREHGGIQVREANDGWSGVVRGAVLTGIGMGIPIPPKVSNCPRHYGICVAQEYKDWQHQEQEEISDLFHGRRMARDPLIWMVGKGDLILPDEPIVNQFTINCKFTASAHRAPDKTVGIKFVASNQDDLPSRLSQLRRDSNQVVDVEIPLSNFDVNYLTAYQQANGGGVYYQVNVTATLKIFKDVKLDIVYQGRSVKKYSTNL